MFYAYEDGQSVPKRLHINFRRRGFTQKKAYIMLYTLFSLVIVKCISTTRISYSINTKVMQFSY